MLCKFSDPNYEWHNDLATRSNSTGRIRPASKRPLKWHKKEMLSLVWLHIGTIVCCASFQTQIMSGTTIYLPGQIQPASKTPLKWPKKLKLSLIWLHTVLWYAVQVLIRILHLLQRFIYPVEFDRSNSTGLKNSFKTAQKNHNNLLI